MNVDKMRKQALRSVPDVEEFTFITQGPGYNGQELRDKAVLFRRRMAIKYPNRRHEVKLQAVGLRDDGLNYTGETRIEMRVEFL